ncbi:MAG TPA: hypothetical protein VGR66_04600 [Candidatus Eisenbacteria bacterium]|nr:hypothetical protein [Candidatus Eisenbacteria bacterium]
MKLLALAVAILTLTGVSQASAQTTTNNEIGPRVGLSINPDQFVIGGQINLPLESARGLAISPNVELGVGDNVTTLQLNADLDYHFDNAGPNWNPYVGGGIGLAFFDFNNDVGGGSESELGVNLLGGLRFRQKSGSHLFTELRLGIGDIPDAKVMVGWNFPM